MLGGPTQPFCNRALAAWNAQTVLSVEGPTYTFSDWRISEWVASVGSEYLEQQN